MSWKAQLRGDPLPWLLESDDPGVRYLALRDLLDLPADDPELIAARQMAHTDGPIAAILAAMEEEGYWARAGAGYNPKYRSGVWSLIALAQLGASVEMDERIGRACAYLLAHSLTAGGQFTASGAPSGTADCLQGNLCATLLDLGYKDARIDAAFEWMARSVTGGGGRAQQGQGRTGTLLRRSVRPRFRLWRQLWRFMRLGRSQSDAGIRQTAGRPADATHRGSYRARRAVPV